MSARKAFAICCAVLGTSLVTRAAETTTETLAQIKANVDAGKAVLVDVREKREWDKGHVEGAIFLPISSLQDGVTKDELKPLPKDKVLYIHCAVGIRALTAGDILEVHGYHVRPIKPGYKQLIEAGFPKAKE